MAIHIDAIYQDGVLRPSSPLDLPNNTPVVITVAPADAPQLDEEDDDELIVPHKRITVEEYRRIMDQCTIEAPPLPPGWDRHDLYSDHD